MKNVTLLRLLTTSIFLGLAMEQLVANLEETRVAEIRELYAEINGAELTWEMPIIPFQDELGGELKRGLQGQVVRKIVLSFDQGDHGGTSYEAYYDAFGQLAFVHSVSSWWKFAGDGESTVDNVTERRIYFLDGAIVRALEKVYSFSGETERSAAGQRAKNQPFNVSDQAARRYLQPFMELVMAEPPRVVVLAEELLRADQLLTEPPASANLDDWAFVSVPERRFAKDRELTPADAALAILIDLDVISEGDQAPSTIYSDVIAETQDSASVVITITDEVDPSIQAVRYLVEIVDNLATWQLMGIGRQTKLWDDAGGWQKQ